MKKFCLLLIAWFLFNFSGRVFSDENKDRDKCSNAYNFRWKYINALDVYNGIELDHLLKKYFNLCKKSMIEIETKLSDSHNHEYNNQDFKPLIEACENMTKEARKYDEEARVYREIYDKFHKAQLEVKKYCDEKVL
jgi:DNA repair ATPase RecN